MKRPLRGLRVQSPSLTPLSSKPPSLTALIGSLRAMGMPVKRARTCAADIQHTQGSMGIIERAAIREIIRGAL